LAIRFLLDVSSVTWVSLLCGTGEQATCQSFGNRKNPVRRRR